MKFRIQYVVRDLTQGKHLAQHFGDFHGSGTYQYWTSGLYHLLYLFDHSFVLFTLGLVDTVVHIDTCNRTVGRDHYDIQFIDIPEFAGFRFSSTGHTGQFVIHTEVVLKCNRCKGLCGSFHLHTFFGFYSLMETVAPAASVHDTAGLLVYDLHLSVHYDVVCIFFEHGVCLQQLVDGMHTF